MTRRNPYLLEAMYRWIIDNGGTPIILIPNPNAQKVSGVPEQFLKQEALPLNISPMSVRNLSITDEGCSFNARFAGQPSSVFVAIDAIHSIAMREDVRHFFILSPEEPLGPEPEPEAPTRPSLKIIK